MKQNYVQIYTNKGINKVSGGLELLFRIIAQEDSIYLGMFVANAQNRAIAQLENCYPHLTVEEYYVAGSLEAAEQSFQRIREALTSNYYSMVIVEGTDMAIAQGLLTPSQLYHLAESSSDKTGLVMIDRCAYLNSFLRNDAEVLIQ
ncbi:MAG: cob(I)yrinic acid a,c-diamide adenosyltransferase [Bacillota bacterium]|nr:cob(I)yrinic acid a,c-diamide adenosyltransferase [Bacillota bacterium]